MGPDRSEIHWGFSMPNRGVLFGATSITEILHLAQTAEESGFFRSVWIGDSLLDRPRVEANVFMGALAAATKEVRLGVSCFASMVVRNPIELAIQWASVDIISGGRSVWVACIGGGLRRELEPFGVEKKDRVPRLRETVDLVRRFWCEDEVTFAGKYFDYRGVRVEPKPVQNPHPPIWYAVTPNDEVLSQEAVDRALSRASRWKLDGWQGADTDAAQIRRLRERTQRLAAESSNGASSPYLCSTHVHITIDDSKEAAWKTARWYFDRYYPEDPFGGPGPISDDVIRRAHIWGTPEDCIDGLLDFADTGCSTVIVRFASLDQTAHMSRFLRDVAPALQEARGAKMCF